MQSRQAVGALEVALSLTVLSSLGAHFIHSMAMANRKWPGGSGLHHEPSSGCIRIGFSRNLIAVFIHDVAWTTGSYDTHSAAVGLEARRHLPHSCHMRHCRVFESADSRFLCMGLRTTPAPDLAAWSF